MTSRQQLYSLGEPFGESCTSKVAGRIVYGGGGDSGGGGGGQPATTTTISKSEPPAYVQPYSEDLMKRAGDLSKQPYQAYTGERIAGLTPEHTSALGAITNRAMSGSPVMNAAAQNLYDTASGAYMSPDSNPYLKQTVDTAMGDAATKVNSQFSGSNYGTTANQEVLGRTMGDVAGNLYGQNYQNERTNQLRTAMFAPQFAESDYRDAQALLGVGDIYRDQSQQGLNQQYEQWMNQQQWPYQQMDVLANAIRTSMGGGGSSVTSSPNAYQANSTANMLGGGLLGYGLGNAAGSPYMGAAGGALLGGLL